MGYEELYPAPNPAVSPKPLIAPPKRNFFGDFRILKCKVKSEGREESRNWRETEHFGSRSRGILAAEASEAGTHYTTVQAATYNVTEDHPWNMLT